MIILFHQLRHLLISLFRQVFVTTDSAEEVDVLLEQIKSTSSKSLDSSEILSDNSHSTMASWGNEQSRPRGRGRGRGVRYNLPPQQRPTSNIRLSSPPGVVPASSNNPSNVHAAYVDRVYEELFEIERQWSSRNHQAAISIFKHHLAGTHTPYSDTLNMISRCSDINEPKSTTLACSLAREFTQWIKRQTSPAETLTEQIQKNAFAMATKNEKVVNGSLLDQIVNAFNLKSVNCLGNSFATKLIEQGKLKEAAILINALGLYSQPDIYNSLVIPLIMLDKISVVENLVRDSPQEQKNLVLFFDKICHRDFSLNSLLPAGRKDIVIRWNRKTMLRQGTRLMKKYHIAADQCPNLSRSQSMAFIRHLLHRRYQEDSLVHDNWAELTRSALADDVDSQAEFVSLLASYDVAEAHHWYQMLGIPDSELPSYVVEYVPDESSSHAPFNEECWDDDDSQSKYYKLKLASDRVHMISTKEQYHDCVANLIQAESGRIGVDAEWKPCFTSSATPRMATLQLATLTDVYVLDMIALGSIPDLDWEPLIEDVFISEQLLKLGYGFRGDMRLLKAAIPSWGERYIGNMLDICSIQAAVCEAKGIQPSGTTEKGLSEAVRLFLGGQVLDKQEQMSNWENRPLRLSQLTYAALDAFCLLELWNVLEKMVEELNIYVCPDNFKSPPPSNKKGKKKVEKKKKEKTTSSTNILGATPPVASVQDVSSFKFVVSNMLQGLGKQLRLLGVDVHIIDDEMGDNHDDAARIAHTEDRIILTSGKPYVRLSAISAPGRCFCMDTELSAREQALAVLKYFNITVTSKNIFSRCQVCNNDMYIIVDRFVMADMHKRYISRPVPSPDDWAKLGPSKGYSQEKITLDNGIHLQLEPVTEKVLSNVDAFFCCARCGKVFWEGSHYHKVHKNFEHLLSA